jgi:hypothetical protein
VPIILKRKKGEKDGNVHNFGFLLEYHFSWMVRSAYKRLMLPCKTKRDARFQIYKTEHVIEPQVRNFLTPKKCSS